MRAPTTRFTLRRRFVEVNCAILTLEKTMAITRRRILAVILPVLILGLGWLVYAPALNGALLFDDTSNLSDLADIDDRLSALLFIFSGDAGPLGRPIALATFAAQADAWGSSPAPFLRVNILIHLINAGLLAWMLYRLARSSGVEEGRRWFVATASAAIWLFMPLLASASLMVIQRMATLEATFVLAALIGYLHAREAIDRSPNRSLAVMSACLVLGTGLAVLTKENGALLPVYVLVLEATLLRRPALGVRWRVWQSAFLLVPAALTIGYVASRVPYASEVVARQEFTGWERLLTETRILWQYLFNAFIPQPGEFGPFHDGYAAVRTLLNPLTMLAFTGWLVLLMLAVAWRRRYPIPAFAVLWFLGGHVLESTVIPLELYFEHRNYLPIIGPVFALCTLVLQGMRSRQRLAYAGLSAYAVLNALVLFTHTTLWGNPPAAAAYWQDHFPDSIRAASAAARYRLPTEGLQGTLQGLRTLAEKDPRAGFVKIPELSLACIDSPEADHTPLVADLRNMLKDAAFNYTVVTMLSELFTTAADVHCDGVDAATVRSLAETLLSNPRYRNDRKYNQLHHQLIARTFRERGKYDEAIGHLRTAMEYQPSPDLNMMIVTTYADAGDFASAREFIEEARQRAPWQPMKRFVWLARLDELSVYIRHLSARRSSGE
ncbi:MAG TPA: hypothetical protein VE175_00775 [Woeseiaceae bacterium]|nr:hypothetical protein [Woeseiaceae bacterium]